MQCIHVSVSQKGHKRQPWVSCTNNSALNFMLSHNYFDFPRQKRWHRIISHQMVGPDCLINQHINIYSNMCLSCTTCERHEPQTQILVLRKKSYVRTENMFGFLVFRKNSYARTENMFGFLHISWEWKEVQCWYWHHCLHNVNTYKPEWVKNS